MTHPPVRGTLSQCGFYPQTTPDARTDSPHLSPRVVEQGAIPCGGKAMEVPGRVLQLGRARLFCGDGPTGRRPVRRVQPRLRAAHGRILDDEPESATSEGGVREGARRGAGAFCSSAAPEGLEEAGDQVGRCHGDSPGGRPARGHLRSSAGRGDGASSGVRWVRGCVFGPRRAMARISLAPAIR